MADSLETTDPPIDPALQDETLSHQSPLMYYQVMDDRDRQLLDELLQGFRDEWQECHSVICGIYLIDEKHDCIHPMPKALLKYEGDGPKCAYCNGNRNTNKPWQIYCSQKCNSAAWRKRERIKKGLPPVGELKRGRKPKEMIESA